MEANLTPIVMGNECCEIVLFVANQQNAAGNTKPAGFAGGSI